MHLLWISIILVAACVYLASDRYKFKLMKNIAMVVIGVSIVLFIISYCNYKGFDVIRFISTMFKEHF